MTRYRWMCLVSLALSAAEPARQEPTLTTTEHFDFAPGGTIRVTGSFGCVSVEGWDRPEVEVTVMRLKTGFYRGKALESATEKLKGVKVKAERRSDRELDISTTSPKYSHWFTVPGSSATRSGIDLEYEIRVPRNSHLVIHHGDGSVIIANVSGEIEASTRSGDVVALLPDPGPYAIDAKTALGTIYNDFGDPKHSVVIGESFASAKPGGAKRVYLRTGIGGISIQEITTGGY
jgi:hypothetical protein